MVLENDLLRLTFTSHGGGARLIELKKYPASVDCRDTTANGVPSALNRFAPLPALTLGVGPLTGDGLFNLRKTEAGVHAEKTLLNGLVVLVLLLYIPIKRSDLILGNSLKKKLPLVHTQDTKVLTTQFGLILLFLMVSLVMILKEMLSLE